MSETVLSVCWKDHTSELATVYKSLLENNFLVDCTISAEGQTLKAHRLILSACSPYFHMLFREETGKHTFVILLDATFETLKAVIDFVYRGEIQIPEGNLKAFLTLAHSLQIKGLNGITQHYKNKNRSSNLTGNASICEDVRPASLMTPLQEHHKPQCDEVSEDAEITVKHEPLHAVFSETRSEKLDSVKIVEGTTKNFISEVDGRTSLYGEEELNFFSKPIKKEPQEDCDESSCGNVDISVMPTAQEQQMQLSFEVSSEQDVAGTNDPLQFAILVPKIEHLDDKDSEELMDDSDLSGNGANEIGDGTEPAFGEQNPDECSRAACFPPEKELATQQPSGAWGRSLSGPQSAEPPFHEHPLFSGDGGVVLGLLPGISAHKRRPAGSDPLHGEAGGKDLGDGPALGRHPRTYPKGGPFRCHLCGQEFTQSGSLFRHIRMHAGERSYRCYVCGKDFTQSGSLARHMRMHTGERPYSCEMCGKGFSESGSLVLHRRVHTGERPYRCDVCGKDFTRSDDLESHFRKHTGERPYRCDVCGVDFRHRASLSYHKRTHPHS